MVCVHDAQSIPSNVLGVERRTHRLASLCCATSHDDGWSCPAMRHTSLCHSRLLIKGVVKHDPSSDGTGTDRPSAPLGTHHRCEGHKASRGVPWECWRPLRRRFSSPTRAGWHGSPPACITASSLILRAQCDGSEPSAQAVAKTAPLLSIFPAATSARERWLLLVCSRPHALPGGCGVAAAAHPPRVNPSSPARRGASALSGAPALCRCRSHAPPRAWHRLACPRWSRGAGVTGDAGPARWHTRGHPGCRARGGVRR